VTTDKLRCASALLAAGVPAIAGDPVDRDSLVERVDWLPFPVVLKPVDGAGSEATFLVRTPADLPGSVAQAWSEYDGQFLVQPYVYGTAASVSLLVGSTGAIALRPAEQLLSGDGRLRYLGGRIPLDPNLARRAVELGVRAIRAIPGLRGYVGIDMVLAGAGRKEIANFNSQNSNAESEISNFKSDPPLTGDVIIEINPRLTTSYIGLRELALANLAERWLQVVSGDIYLPIDWRPGTIGFSAGGQVAYLTRRAATKFLLR
jgi:predicted ATP-grasp superfamily ATP-dependent carboligase